LIWLSCHGLIGVETHTHQTTAVSLSLAALAASLLNEDSATGLSS
jgi:hypothetical protein